MSNPDLYVAMSQDGRLARVSIETAETQAHAVLDPDQVSTVIRELSRIRARMASPFPTMLDANPRFDDAVSQTVFQTGRHKGDPRTFYLAVLHPGYGWLCFVLNDTAGQDLAKMLTDEVRKLKGIILRPDGMI